MFSLLRGIYEQYRQKPSFNILIIGPASSGKSTLLEALKAVTKGEPIQEKASIVPTIGLNVGRCVYENVIFQFWDLGGSGDLSRLWRNYYSDSQVVLYVIDYASKSEFKTEFMECELLGLQVPMAVVVNKLDICPEDSARIIAEVENSSCSILPKLKVFGVSGKSGTGILELVRWIRDDGV